MTMQTGLHRNTISKVYRQLEDEGFVESLAGSGIYVRTQGHEGGSRLQLPIIKQSISPRKIFPNPIVIFLSTKLCPRLTPP